MRSSYRRCSVRLHSRLSSRTCDDPAQFRLDETQRHNGVTSCFFGKFVGRELREISVAAFAARILVAASPRYVFVFHMNVVASSSFEDWYGSTAALRLYPENSLLDSLASSVLSS